MDYLSDAMDYVNRVIAYESTPPGTAGPDDFYNHFTLAAQFQCCRKDVEEEGLAQRTFIESAESVRGPLVDLGYDVDRLYQRSVNNGCLFCGMDDKPYTGDPTPRRYYDGTPLPAELGPNSGFTWKLPEDAVKDAWNAGRFLILHRAHGSKTGWGLPKFSKDDAEDLTNAPWHPVVFSINCSTGLFDNETSNVGLDGLIYFAEYLIRPKDGGAIGVVAATRDSPSWTNSVLARGLFDAIWPSILPAFGDDSSKRRLGDIMNHAKLYVLTRMDVGPFISYENVYDEMRLFHVIGDPTLEIWRKDPNNLTLPSNFSLGDVGMGNLTLNYILNGAVITAYQETPDGPRPVGRATVAGGQAQLAFFESPVFGEELLLSAQMGDSVVATGSVMLPSPQ